MGMDRHLSTAFSTGCHAHRICPSLLDLPRTSAEAGQVFNSPVLLSIGCRNAYSHLHPCLMEFSRTTRE